MRAIPSAAEAGQAKAMRIYLDFDGPLVDNRAKYYALYGDALRDQGAVPLPQPRYWDLKRHRVPDEQICALTASASSIDVDAERYLRYRDHWIEDDRYTALDELVDGIDEAMTRWLAEGHELRIATMRRRGDVLRREMTRLGIDRWCDHVLSEDGNQGEWQTKARLLQADLSTAPAPEAAIIGDTEGDILAAREAGISAIAVTDGLRCGAMLRLYGPDALLPTSAAFSTPR